MSTGQGFFQLRLVPQIIMSNDWDISMSGSWSRSALLATAILLVLSLATRLFLVLHSIRLQPPSPKRNPSLLVVLGSGGHTGEMLSLTKSLDVSHYSKITLVHASSDALSASRAKQHFGKNIDKVTCVPVTRARSVHQSWISSIRTSLICLFQCLQIVHSTQPDLIVCNGPAICVMVGYAAFLLQVLGLCHARTLYIESLARVSTLSLSGKLMFPICNRFIVQWPQLAQKLNCECHGILV